MTGLTARSVSFLKPGGDCLTRHSLLVTATTDDGRRDFSAARSVRGLYGMRSAPQCSEITVP